MLLNIKFFLYGDFPKYDPTPMIRHELNALFDGNCRLQVDCHLQKGQFQEEWHFHHKHFCSDFFLFNKVCFLKQQTFWTKKLSAHNYMSSVANVQGPKSRKVLEILNVPGEHEQESGVFGLGLDLVDDELGARIATSLWLGGHCAWTQRDVVRICFDAMSPFTRKIQGYPNSIWFQLIKSYLILSYHSQL